MKEIIQKRPKQIGIGVIKLVDELPNKPSLDNFETNHLEVLLQLGQIIEQPAGQIPDLLCSKEK